MSFRKRLLVFVLILLVAAGATALFSPFIVAHGLRFWLEWAARHEGVQVEIGKIDAPFLRPVTIDRLRVAPAATNGHEIHLQAAQIAFDLNFRGQIFGRHPRLLHSLTVERVQGNIRHGAAHGAAQLDWRSLQRLLPDDFRFGAVDLDVATAATAFRFRGVTLNASEIEAGKFFAHEISVTSPVLRQTFHDLRGATAWEANRLTIAGVSLVRGLDLEALTVDLSSLTKRRIGLDFQLDAFGGTLRASFQARADAEKLAVDLAGSASDISLAQISQAAGFVEPLSGALRASKFTFRGNPGEFLDATASVWIELRDFAWRARRADSVVFGATYYDRRLQVEQLYVQQQRNELTVNGELLWPKKPVGWAALPFRGQLNATIPDANRFAQLFGARPGDFSGALFANGEIDSLDPAAHGQLALRGVGVSFRGVALDSLGATMQLRGSEVTLEKLELRHGDDFARAQGTSNLKAPHTYSARLTGAINNLAEYAPLLPKGWRSAAIGGGMTFDWSGDGTAAAHSGTMQLFAHGLQLPVAPLRSPLDVTLEGTYSPQDVFFRTCRLANEHFSLGGFVMLGSNFIELQALELLLHGEPQARGTLFLPFGVDRWRKSGSLLEAFDERQKFDVDLMVEHLDLAKLDRAVGEKTPLSGVLDGKLAVYGPLASLQLTTDWHLKNLGPAKAQNALDFDLHYDAGRADGNLHAVFGVSSPLVARASIPLRLDKRWLNARSVVDPSQPFTGEVDCPALFLEMLPEPFAPLGAWSGLLTGQIGYANTWSEPRISGAAQLFDGEIHPAPPWPGLTNLSAEIRFENQAAVIPSFRFEAGDSPFQGRASLTTRPPFFDLTIWPVAETVALAHVPQDGAFASAIRVLGRGGAGDAPHLEKAIVSGKAGSPIFTLTMTTGSEPTRQTTLFFDPRAAVTDGPLQLSRSAPPNDKRSLWP